MSFTTIVVGVAIAGLFVGVVCGITLCAMLTVSKRADEAAERWQ